MTADYPFRVSTETDPPQPEVVVRAIAEALHADEPAPDPWWRAGILEALRLDVLVHLGGNEPNDDLTAVVVKIGS